MYSNVPTSSLQETPKQYPVGGTVIAEGVTGKHLRTGGDRNKIRFNN